MCIVPPRASLQSMIGIAGFHTYLVLWFRTRRRKWRLWQRLGTRPHFGLLLCRAYRHLFWFRPRNGCCALGKILLHSRDMRRIYFPHPIILWSRIHTNMFISSVYIRFGVPVKSRSTAAMSCVSYGNTNEFHLFIENLLENCIILISAGELQTSRVALWQHITSTYGHAGLVAAI